MEQISRNVFVLRDAVKEPIDYVRFTNAIPLAFVFQDYDIPSGATAKVFCAKPSGKAVYSDATISGNMVTVTVTDQMFIELGRTEVQVEILSGESKLVTFSWPVNVKPNYTEGDIPSSQNVDGFFEEAQKAIDEAYEAAGEATEAAGVANDAADAANQAVAAITGKLGINDDIPSEGTTYSSDKIEAMAQTNLITDYLLKTAVGAGIRSYVSLSGNKLIVTINATTGYGYGYVDLFDLVQGEEYTLSWKSSRSGNAGGGIWIQQYLNNGVANTIDSSKRNTLNSEISFVVPVNAEGQKVRIQFMAGNSGDPVGQKAEFWDIMLVEGGIPSPYIPDAYKQTELAAIMNKRSAVNLISIASPIAVRSSVESSGNGIKVTATGVTDSLNAYCSFTVKVKSNTNYTFSFYNPSYSGAARGCEIYQKTSSGLTRIYAGSKNNDSVTFNTGDATEIQINLIATLPSSFGGKNGDYAVFTDIMLVEGSFEGRSYVPYIGFETLSEAIADLQSKLSALQASTANSMMYVLSDDTQAKMIEDETSMLLKEAQS